MFRTLHTVAVFAAIVATGCAPTTHVGTVSMAPALGKADATDSADHGCQVILRTVIRQLDGEGALEVDGGSWVWMVDVDVATSLGATGAVLYQPSPTDAWYAFDGDGIAGAPAGFQRYRARVADHTAPMPSWSASAIAAAQPALAAYAQRSDGSRLFDHNRLASDFANYTLDAAHQFALSDDGACLAAARPTGTLDFTVTGPQTQRGALVAGGQISVTYDPTRLQTCRSTHNGNPFWSLEANLRFLPNGELAVGSVISSNGTDVSPTAFVADIPAGATSVDLWFHNAVPGECDAWDSDYGNNYHAAVVATRPAAVGWAGDWGSSFSRDCTHVDGVADPAIIDEYVRERACAFVDADVWAPGTTDADHPEWVFAKVEWTKTSATTSTTPVTMVSSWLTFVDRVGNNGRFRWTLPYELRSQSDWTTARYRFRFSTDGLIWFSIGEGAGPDGGADRNLTWAQ